MEKTKLIHLWIGEEEIVTTEEHPFWVAGQGFVEAGKLREGFLVEKAGGDLARVSKAEAEYLTEPVTVYNFEVEDWHTYYVSEEEIFVHNMCAVEVVSKSGSNFNGHLYKGTRSPEVDFVNGKGKSTLNKHAEKHGYTSSEEYLNDARNFLEKQPTLTTQSFVSSEGTYFRYDTATNEFGIINQYGGISTYYKPEDGMSYWLEQIEKYAPK